MPLGCIHYFSTCHPHLHHGPCHTVSGLDDYNSPIAGLSPSDLPFPRHSPKTARVVLELVLLLVSNPFETSYCHYKEVPTPSHGIGDLGHPAPANLSALELPLATQPEFTLWPEEFHSVYQNSCVHSSPLPSTFPPTYFL